MSAVLWHIFMSLDGFISGPDDDMRWVWDYAGPDPDVDEIVRTTGALIVGRRTYEVEDRDRSGFYGGAWTGSVFVVTHQMPSTVPDWMTGTFVTDGIESAVRQAKAAAGGKNVGILGAGIARQCLDAGVLDEIVVQVAPTMLGVGVRMFSREDRERVRLERVAASTPGLTTNLRFKVLK